VIVKLRDRNIEDDSYLLQSKIINFLVDWKSVFFLKKKNSCYHLKIATVGSLTPFDENLPVNWIK
jgi:hypothetical protein